MKKKAILITLFFVLTNSMVMAETLRITTVPIQLPRNLSLGSYSPLLEFDYSGLKQDHYTLKLWLLNREPWHCASSQICEKIISVNNSNGQNPSGTLRIVQNMDVHNYSDMAFVARLYSSAEVQVAWDKKYVDGVSNRPPKLDFIANQNGVVGQPLSFVANATDPEGHTLTYWASNLPEGAVLEPDGTFRWTPHIEGTFDIYISVDDGTTYDSQQVRLDIAEIPDIVETPEFAHVYIPPCGSTQNVTGQVENFGNADNYKIVSYIFISGRGWWVKPYENQPKTDIQPDGTFEVNITTAGIDGIDELATIVYLGICHEDADTPLLAGSASIPDNLPVLTAQKHFRNPEACHRVIEFSGYRWYVKSSGSGTLGPGPCYFGDSSQNVFVDEKGHLHLQIFHDGTRWNCAEIVCLDEMGYGTYTFELESDPSILDKNTVLGLFTWADDAENGKEIDIEYSRWGDSQNPNGQFVVQPWNLSGHRHRFEFPSTDSPSTHRFQWQKGKAMFQVYINEDNRHPHDSIVSRWTFMGNTPKPGRVHPRINLWLLNNQPPSDEQPQTVIIRRFHFSSNLHGLIPIFNLILE